MSATTPVRAPIEVVAEISAASRLFDVNASALVEAAWKQYSSSPEFAEAFKLAQKAFAAGDLGSVVEQMHDQGQQRAARNAARIESFRS